MPHIDAQELLLLRLEALRSVLKNDADFTYRSICRWYSQHYNTPLHEVGTPTGMVSMEDVLQTFYEARYSEMDDAKKEAEIQDLLTTPEEEVEAALRADVNEAENWMFARNVEKQERKKKEKERLEEVKSRERQTITNKEGSQLVPKQRPLPPANLGEGGLPAPQVPRPAMSAQPRAPQEPLVTTNLPEDVKIVFMTDAEMEADAACMDPFSIQKGAPKLPK